MPDDSGQQAGTEGDLFDRWLAHRDADGAPGAPPRDRTMPPTWAPPVVAPRPSGDDSQLSMPPAYAEPLAAPPATPAPAAQQPVAVAPTPPPPVAATVQLPAPSAPSAPSRRPEAEPVVPVDRVAVPLAAPAPEPADDAPAGETTLEQEPLEPEQGAHDRADNATGPTARISPRAFRRSLPAADEPPVRMTFRPRTRARTAVGVGAALAATAGVVGTVAAFHDRDTPSTGIAVTLWVLTGIIWAVHSGTSVTRLSVRGGQLQVLQHGVRTTIDLTSSYTPVEVHGRPGRHGWKVVFRRRDMSAFVIDHSMVDPNEFMRVLRYYRPGVDAGEQ